MKPVGESVVISGTVDFVGPVSVHGDATSARAIVSCDLANLRRWASIAGAEVQIIATVIAPAEPGFDGVDLPDDGDLEDHTADEDIPQ